MQGLMVRDHIANVVANRFDSGAPLQIAPPMDTRRQHF
jgi:hypothetical protein